MAFYFISFLCYAPGQEFCPLKVLPFRVIHFNFIFGYFFRSKFTPVVKQRVTPICVILVSRISLWYVTIIMSLAVNWGVKYQVTNAPTLVATASMTAVNMWVTLWPCDRPTYCRLTPTPFLRSPLIPPPPTTCCWSQVLFASQRDWICWRAQVEEPRGRRGRGRRRGAEVILIRLETLHLHLQL